jgi:hypothetical protein
MRGEGAGRLVALGQNGRCNEAGSWGHRQLFALLKRQGILNGLSPVGRRGRCDCGFAAARARLYSQWRQRCLRTIHNQPMVPHDARS